jgi:hypothetical protein
VNNPGWFRVNRKMFEYKLWFSEPFTKSQAWIDLFGNTNHKEGSFFVRGNEINIKRGQIGWSEVTMAKRWTWSRNKVRNFLKWLEKEQQIKQQKDRYLTTIITILNYEKYQNDTANDTAERQQKDSRRYINKNDKNDKNVKKRERKYTHPNNAHLDNFFLKDVASKCQVPLSFVLSKYEDMVLWHEQDPAKNKKIDWKATLRAWVKKDSLKIKQDYAKQNSDIAL